MDFDFLAVTGDFQPFHHGHERVISDALERAGCVIVLVGGPSAARSIRQPFSFEERTAMIKAAFAADATRGRILIRPVEDDPYDAAAWAGAVRIAVSGAIREVRPKQGAARGTIAIRGIAAAARSYQRLFPKWTTIETGPRDERFSSARIRDAYFRQEPDLPRGLCPAAVVAMLDAFKGTAAFQRLAGEADWVRAEKKSWAGAPFPPVFVTADCVVMQAGHVLLVRRGGQPGLGLLALPGGFVESSELLRDAAIRELCEETGLADQAGPVLPEQLSGWIDGGATRVFDAPDRSVRGRTITHAFLFRLPGRRLFRVTGGDDAAQALWIKLEDLDPRALFEDHRLILKALTGA